MRPVVSVHDEPDGGQRLTIDDLRAFRDQLGSEVTEAFCSCFVHTDRLSSLAHWSTLLEKHGESGIVVTRDLYTILWLGIGSLREFGSALDWLKGCLRRSGLFDKTNSGWTVLNEISRTWVHSDKYKELRNVVAFHVKQELVSSGLQKIVDEQQPVTLGISDKDKRGSTRLGLDSQLQGIGWTADEFLELFELVSGHLVLASDNLHTVFADALNRRGIKMQSAEPPA